MVASFVFVLVVREVVPTCLSHGLVVDVCGFGGILLLRFACSYRNDLLLLLDAKAHQKGDGEARSIWTKASFSSWKPQGHGLSHFQVHLF